MVTNLALVFLLLNYSRLSLALCKSLRLWHKLLSRLLRGLCAQILDLGLAEDDVGI